MVRLGIEAQGLQPLGLIRRALRATGGSLVFTVGWLLAAAAVAADSEPGSPATRLYDVPRGEYGTTSLERKEGWKLVPQERLTHKFAGAPLVANDKLVAFVSGTMDFCFYAASGPIPRYPISIRAASREPKGTPEIRIVENGDAAVTLEMRWKNRDGSAAGSITFRLTAGQPIIEIRPGNDVRAVAITQAWMQYGIVPDFFGDDMVFHPSSRDRKDLDPLLSAGRASCGLPTENFFLGLSPAEVLMCVWSSCRQGVGVTGANPQSHFYASYEVQCVAGKPIWLGLLSGAGIWHVQGGPGRGADDWKPPFPAKWRADLVGEGFPPRSWFFDGKLPSPPAPLPQVGEGRGMPSPPARSQTGEGRGVPSPMACPQTESRVVVYPIDRDRQTPLDVFTPMDVLRNTLGVGPCQYILQTEGLGSENNPTPDNVMTWVEKQFARKKQKKSADEIREMLGQMGSQVAATQARIERYAAFARELHKLVGGKELMPAGATGMMSLQQTLVYLDRSLADDASAKVAERTQQLTKEVAALMERADAADECRKLGAAARQIGLTQERTLARCRMAVRWVHAQAKMAAAETAADVKTLELAKTVQARTEEILYAK